MLPESTEKRNYLPVGEREERKERKEEERKGGKEEEGGKGRREEKSGREQGMERRRTKIWYFSLLFKPTFSWTGILSCVSSLTYFHSGEVCAFSLTHISPFLYPHVFLNKF